MQNPVLNIITQGGQAVSNTLTGASQSLANANNAISQAGSIAVKLDLYLQNEEARKSQEVMQAQQMMNNQLHSIVQEDLQNRQLALQNKQFEEGTKEFKLNYGLAVDKYKEGIREFNLTNKYRNNVFTETKRHNKQTEKNSALTTKLAKDKYEFYKAKTSLDEFTKINNNKIANLTNQKKIAYNKMLIFSNIPNSPDYKDAVQAYNQIANKISAINAQNQQAIIDFNKKFGINMPMQNNTNTNYTSTKQYSQNTQDNTYLPDAQNQQAQYPSVFVANHLPSKDDIMLNKAASGSAIKNNIFAQANLIDKINTDFSNFSSNDLLKKDAGKKGLAQHLSQLLNTKNIDYDKFGAFFSNLKKNYPKNFNKAISLLQNKYDQDRINQIVQYYDSKPQINKLVTDNIDKAKNYMQAITGHSLSEISRTQAVDYYQNLNDILFKKYGVNAVDKLFKGDLISGRWTSLLSDAKDHLLSFIGLGNVSPINVDMFSKNNIRQIPDSLKNVFAKNVIKPNKVKEWKQLGSVMHAIKRMIEYKKDISNQDPVTIGRMKLALKHSITKQDKELYKKIFHKDISNADTNDKVILLNQMYDPEHSSYIDKEALKSFTNKAVEKLKKLPALTKDDMNDNDIKAFMYFVLTPASIQASIKNQ